MAIINFGFTKKSKGILKRKANKNKTKPQKINKKVNNSKNKPQKINKNGQSNKKLNQKKKSGQKNQRKGFVSATKRSGLTNKSVKAKTSKGNLTIQHRNRSTGGNRTKKTVNSSNIVYIKLNNEFRPNTVSKSSKKGTTTALYNSSASINNKQKAKKNTKHNKPNNTKKKPGLIQKTGASLITFHDTVIAKTLNNVQTLKNLAVTDYKANIARDKWARGGSGSARRDDYVIGSTTKSSAQIKKDKAKMEKQEKKDQKKVEDQIRNQKKWGDKITNTKSYKTAAKISPKWVKSAANFTADMPLYINPALAGSHAYQEKLESKIRSGSSYKSARDKAAITGVKTGALTLVLDVGAKPVMGAAKKLGSKAVKFISKTKPVQKAGKTIKNVSNKIQGKTPSVKPKNQVGTLNIYAKDLKSASSSVTHGKQTKPKTSEITQIELNKPKVKTAKTSEVTQAKTPSVKPKNLEGALNTSVKDLKSASSSVTHGNQVKPKTSEITQIELNKPKVKTAKTSEVTQAKAPSVKPENLEGALNNSVKDIKSTSSSITHGNQVKPKTSEITQIELNKPEVTIKEPSIKDVLPYGTKISDIKSTQEGYSFIKNSEDDVYKVWGQYGKYLNQNASKFSDLYAKANKIQQESLDAYVNEGDSVLNYTTMNGLLRDTLFEYDANGKIKNVVFKGMHSKMNLSLEDYLQRISSQGVTLSEVISENKKAILAIGKMMKISPIEENTVLFRGIHRPENTLKRIGQTDTISNPLNFEELKEKLIGKEFCDNGFLSTSVCTDASPIYGRDVIMALYTKKGTPAIDMSEFGGLTGEQEVLVAPFSKFIIKNVTKEKGPFARDRYVIHCEMTDDFNAEIASEQLNKRINDTFEKYENLVKQIEATHIYPFSFLCEKAV